MRKATRRWMTSLGSLGLAGATAFSAQPPPTRPPNILLVLADDMGYADAGCYGGEIETPAIDRLAVEGVRFTRFRATPMCVTSRVALLSGMSYFANGQGRYERAKPLPQALREAGYRTAIAGKWHASNGHPLDEGFFDRFHGFLGGMTDCYAGGTDWYLEREPFRDFGPGFDATTAITDYSIQSMRAALDDGLPFFMFVSYNAPHHPLQARRKTVDKYADRYRDGFAAVRDRRIGRQRRMGLQPDGFVPAPPDLGIRPWDQMTDFRRETEAMRMAAYAAMVDEMDQGIGRLLAFLDERGIRDDTLVVFASDNGGYYSHGDIRTDHLQKPWAPRSNQTVSSGWAWVQNAPFSLYKQTCHEGGLAVPFIVRWPRALAGREGALSDIEADFTDLYPAFLQLAGASHPATWKGEAAKPLAGKSFWPALLRGEPFDPPVRFHAFLNPRYHESRALIDGAYKLVAIHNGPWRLFDMESDRGETTDLSAAMPARRARMATQWHDHAEAIGVPPSARAPESEDQREWGWQRLLMFCPQLLGLQPDNGKWAAPGTDRLEMRFGAPLDFSASRGRIRLYKQSDEENPVWDIRLDGRHPSQGTTVLRCENLAPLEPDTHYFFLVDAGAFRVGGTPVGQINDGAYWWRFRTAQSPHPRKETP